MPMMPMTRITVPELIAEYPVAQIPGHVMAFEALN